MRRSSDDHENKKAPSKRILNATHGAFISPIGFPDEFYAVFIEPAIIQFPYTLDGYKLSKAAPIEDPCSDSTVFDPEQIGLELTAERLTPQGARRSQAARNALAFLVQKLPRLGRNTAGDSRFLAKAMFQRALRSELPVKIPPSSQFPT